MVQKKRAYVLPGPNIRDLYAPLPIFIRLSNQVSSAKKIQNLSIFFTRITDAKKSNSLKKKIAPMVSELFNF